MDTARHLARDDPITAAKQHRQQHRAGQLYALPQSVMVKVTGTLPPVLNPGALKATLVSLTALPCVITISWGPLGERRCRGRSHTAHGDDDSAACLWTGRHSENTRFCRDEGSFHDGDCAEPEHRRRGADLRRLEH